MPHYIDGTDAKPGDIVRGKGYNIKDDAGELAEIVAVVTHVQPNASACNITVLVPSGHVGSFIPGGGHGLTHGHVLTGRVEYGQCDHFEKVR